MNVVLLLGIVSLGFWLVGRGMWTLTPLIQYYLGWRKDFYFLPNRDWQRMMKDQSGGIAMGLGIIFTLGSTAIAARSSPYAGVGMAYGAIIFSGFVALAFSTFAYRIIPSKPIWVRQFEKEHIEKDLVFIRQRGEHLLTKYPRRFPNFINSQGGWEEWLMTVV